MWREKKRTKVEVSTAVFAARAAEGGEAFTVLLCDGFAFSIKHI